MLAFFFVISVLLNLLLWGDKQKLRDSVAMMSWGRYEDSEKLYIMNRLGYLLNDSTLSSVGTEELVRIDGEHYNEIFELLCEVHENADKTDGSGN